MRDLVRQGSEARAIGFTGRPPRRSAWLATEEVASELGCVSTRWVRHQIVARRLRATVLTTGGRVTYRIARTDLDAFRHRYLRDSWDPDWHGER